LLVLAQILQKGTKTKVKGIDIFLLSELRERLSTMDLFVEVSMNHDIAETKNNNLSYLDTQLCIQEQDAANVRICP